MILFKYATLEEGREILGRKDSYLKRLTSTEYALKMKSDKVVMEAEFLNFLQSCILPWEEQETNKLDPVLEKVAVMLDLHINFEEPILLVKTDGREEWNSAYTRENAIVLPQKRIKNDNQERLIKLIIHEVFHVISKKYPALRNLLYGMLGFEKINEILLPEQLCKIKLTNPDAPLLNYFTSVNYKDKLIPVTPITLLKENRNNINAQKDILNSITTKLLVLEKHEGKFQVSTGNKGYILLSIAEIKGLKEKIKMDTGDFQHPEETIAEIFTKIVAGETNSIPGKILKGMKQLLIKAN